MRVFARFCGLACAGVLLLWMAQASADDVTRYVTGDGVQVRHDPNPFSPVVGTLDRGDAVVVHETQGGWSLVEKAGLAGWVSNASLADQAPGTSGGLRSGLDLANPFKPSAGADTTATRGARGLEPIAADYARAEGVSEASIRAVDELLGYSVTDAEITRFIQEGGLR